METERVLRSLVDDLKPVRRLAGVEWRTLLWTGFALLCVSVGTYALGARSDLTGKIRDPAYLRDNALLFLAFALAASSAFHLSVPGAERSAVARTLPFAALLLWVGLVSSRHPTMTSNSFPAAAAWMNGWSCVLKMSFLVLAPAVAALLMLRKAAPLSPGWTGWFALLSAASLSLLGSQILCPRDDPRHVLLWHFVPLLAAGLVGIRLGRWLLRRPSVRV